MLPFLTYTLGDFIIIIHFHSPIRRYHKTCKICIYQDFSVPSFTACLPVDDISVHAFYGFTGYPL